MHSVVYMYWKTIQIPCGMHNTCKRELQVLNSFFVAIFELFLFDSSSQMNQDSEKWPIFEQSPSKSRGGSTQGQSGDSQNRNSAPYLMEETDSGMFTLRKKKDKEAPRVQLNGSGLVDSSQTSTPVM